MQRYNICEKYMKIVVEMNKNNTRIKTGNTLTAAIPITTGMWQEDSLSLIFNLNGRNNKVKI
jgi:hypothetical protein